MSKRTNYWCSFKISFFLAKLLNKLYIARGAALWSWSAFTSRITSLFKELHVEPNFLQMGCRGFFKSLQSKAASSGSCALQLKKKRKKKKESLWSAISAVNKHTSDKIAYLTSSCFTSSDLLPLSRCCPSVTSALISVFIFVTWAWCEWNLGSLAVHDPFPNQQQPIPGRYCSTGKGSGGTFGDQMLSSLSAPSPWLNAS